MHIVFHRHKKSFLIIEMKLHHCNETTSLHYFKKEHLRKTVLLYVIVTVSHGTYLGIDQSMKRKFVSSTANTWKSHIFDTDFVICSCFFAFSGLVQFHYHSRDNNVS